MYPIDFFYRAARLFPARIAIESSSEQISYADLAEKVAALAVVFQAYDSEPQSRVGICASNSVDHLVALLAVLAAGKTWVPLNPRSSATELNRIIEVTQPSILVADVKYLAVMSQGAAVHVLVTGGGDGTHPGLRQLTAGYASQKPKPISAGMDAVQAIKFTGGSTGMPKGVMQPYRAWAATLINQIHAYRFDQDDRYLLAAPVTHGASTYVLPILAQGGCHILLDEVNPKAVLNAFRQQGVTTTFMPPTLIYMLMAEAGCDSEHFPALRHLIYGGAPMPTEKIKAVQRFFGPVLETTYGQTEAPQIVTFMSASEFTREENIASVGRMALVSDMAIMNPEGEILPTGEVGEIVVRGDLVMTGYWKMPDMTDQTIINGWLHTGDRGYLDARGYLYLRDRLREVIITGGFNVYPIDVENVLTQHPAVHESAVFGLDDDKWGEAVHAVVQLKLDQNVSEQDLIDFSKKELGSVKSPKHIYFYPNLPRSAVGKVQKDLLKTEVAGRIAAAKK